MSQIPYGCCGVTRRGFLLGAGVGFAAGLPLGLVGLRALGVWNGDFPTFTGRSVEVKRPEFAMPGPYPGRVIEVHHPGAVGAEHEIKADAVQAMMRRGMCELTGTDHAVEGWKRFFEKGDVVGIKVNPVGRKPNKGDSGRVATAVGSISSPEVLLEIVAGLKEAGVRPKDIIVFERYANEFRDAGYEAVMAVRAMDGVRWCASSAAYDGAQVDIEGYPAAHREGRDAHVVGYDPDVFVEMGFAAPEHDRKDDRRFRSHLSVIVSRMVNKIVTIPVLKDHRSAGVTLALKNMSHGMNNNVARSHLPKKYYRRDQENGPNQCNTFIPTAAGQRLLREKATLHVMDGLIGVYEGGPGCWNQTWGTWRRQSLFFATDPVALDLVGWDIIDRKRMEEGWQPVGRMGLIQERAGLTVAAGLAGLGAGDPAEAAALTLSGQNFLDGRTSESFDRRQPEHVILAGTIGLGIFDRDKIDYRHIVV